LANVLVILLIFVVGAPSVMISSGFPVDLPRVITSAPISRKGFSVSVLSDDSFLLEGRRIADRELDRFLKNQQGKDFRIFIKADRRARVGTLVRVWDLCREYGAATVSIATYD
jgi:biopolymer transport protein ExbD